MASPKRLVLFVEGEGDESAAPVLVRRLITELQGWDCLWLDPQPFRVGAVTNLVHRQANNWPRYLLAAARRGNLGAVLLLQDGDVSVTPGQAFCPCNVGRDLANAAWAAGAGAVFSVACVFALQEYESWLIAGVESLAGVSLPDGREGVQTGTTSPAGDLEMAPRDAKSWLSAHMPQGYSQTTHQEPLTRLVDLDFIRQRNLRSFRRLENALRQLIEAVRSGQHVITPAPPP